MSSAQLAAPQLSSDEVLRVARLDAERAYRDLSRFIIRIARESDGWHVDFDLKDATARGGGPHYVIDPDSGDIVTKRYEQLSVMPPTATSAPPSSPRRYPANSPPLAPAAPS